MFCQSIGLFFVKSFWHHVCSLTSGNPGLDLGPVLQEVQWKPACVLARHAQVQMWTRLEFASIPYGLVEWLVGLPGGLDVILNALPKFDNTQGLGKRTMSRNSMG